MKILKGMKINVLQGIPMGFDSILMFSGFAGNRGIFLRNKKDFSEHFLGSKIRSREK